MKSLIVFQKEISLARHTSFRIGGKARYFFEAKNEEELILALKTAKKMKLSVFILGGGSNLLVSDKGFNGLVIKMQNRKMEIKGTEVIIGAGVYLGHLLNAVEKAGLTGLEWASGIPGTLGGAVFGNAGAFGKSMEGSVSVVEAISAKSLKKVLLKNKECKFGYRNSIFKKGGLIIVSAVLKLKKGKKSEIRKKMKECLDYRRKNQPLNFPSAGSVFKNPKGFFAAKIIEDCGLKGKKIGRAQVSEKHANFIINLGGAEEKDVRALMKLIKEVVKKKFKISLKEEIMGL